jgi:tRNA dimethylallyltransferase
MVSPAGLTVNNDVTVPALRTPLLTGTTASGKTALSLEIARLYRARTGRELELINADSLLFYRFMDIGTAKPTREEQTEIPHHGIDWVTPGEPFTAADFAQFTQRCLQDIHARGNRALIVGGTGFYLKALLFGLWAAPPTDAELRARLEPLSTEALRNELLGRDPASAEKIGANDRYRLIRAIEIHERSGNRASDLESEARKRPPSEEFLFCWIDQEKTVLDERIRERARRMIAAGIVEETRDLVSRFPTAPELKAVGYRQTRDFLEGRTPSGRKIQAGLPGLEGEITLATRQLAKAQRTFFKGLEKDLIRRTGDPARVLFGLLPGDAARVRDHLLDFLTS